MSCAVATPTFSPSNCGASSISIYNSLSSGSTTPMSPSSNKNMVLRLQQLEGPVSSYHHHHHHHHHHDVHKELPLLKRKRPTKLNLPVVAELGNLLDDMDGLNGAHGGNRQLEEVEVDEDGYAVYCKRGRLRSRMEDRHSVLVDHGDNKQAFFGIFDGHGGPKAAEHTAAKLGKNILNQVVGLETQSRSEKIIEEKVKEGYLATDDEFLRSENPTGGTCCVTALVQNGSLIVSNVGDCRAVISRGGIAEALTDDHTPARDDEKTRIESKGGYVDNCNGTWRIQGSLAVSRAIGDRHLKQWVTAEPETRIIDIQPDLEFLILASDGLWNKVSVQEAVDMARLHCKTPGKKAELARACRSLAELSISRGSSDDTSVMIIQLGQFCELADLS